MPTILIVEDNEDIRLNLVEYLESKNYQTDNTDDGLKALALTIVNKYDLIVLDIMIPGMDGLRLCRELRSRGNTTPIIILSAKDSTDDRIMGLSEGADDYIVKPFSLAELLLRIQAAVQRRKKKFFKSGISGSNSTASGYFAEIRSSSSIRQLSGFLPF